MEQRKISNDVAWGTTGFGAVKEQLLSSLSAPHSCDSPALFMAPDRLFHADMYLEVYCQSIINPSTVVLRIQGSRTLDQTEHQVPSNFGVCILRARTYDELTYDVIIAQYYYRERRRIGTG